MLVIIGLVTEHSTPNTGSRNKLGQSDYTALETEGAHLRNAVRGYGFALVKCFHNPRGVASATCLDAAWHRFSNSYVVDQLDLNEFVTVLAENLGRSSLTSGCGRELVAYEKDFPLLLGAMRLIRKDAKAEKLARLGADARRVTPVTNRTEDALSRALAACR
jgi:hypothetical protein